MKTYPILFSTKMVQAILEGRKTQTRRVVKADISNCYFQSLVHHHSGKFTFVDNNNFSPTEDDVIEAKCPYGSVGDVLWVREMFCPTGSSEYLNQDTGLPFFYKADVRDSATEKEVMNQYGWKYKPSIHMPKEACRIFLKITNIRVERLQDISEDDAITEGVRLSTSGKKYLNYQDERSKVTQFIYNCDTAKKSFSTLWMTINGFRDEPFAWYRNPWVWVIEFERTVKPENF